MESKRHLIYRFDKPALMKFFKQRVSSVMISYVTKATIDVATSLNAEDTANSLPPLENFIHHLVVASNVPIATFMSTLVYLTLVKSTFSPGSWRKEYIPHGVFLGALILSDKFLQDDSLENWQWAMCTKMKAYNFGFRVREVNQMETDLLLHLGYKIRITEDDLYRELHGFLQPICINTNALLSDRSLG
ncbi:cyclin [Trichoderma harzianum]|uniref:Cyclin n=1 Tax=Trichoderma harzianum TaxID=5544 RepID=A0A0F9X6P2_TRIHA|nr:cyclin [Trichoderma harzianum]